MEPNQLPKVGRTRFTDGAERDVFEDALGRQFVEDDGAPVAGQWLPPADEPAVVERPSPGIANPDREPQPDTGGGR